MHFEDWISFRYVTAKKDKFLFFLNFISITGVAIGVMALIVVTAVMTGFGNNLREKIIGTTSHVVIEKETGIKNYEGLREQIKDVEGVVGSSAYIQGNIFLENANQATTLAIRGVDPVTEKQVTKVKDYLIRGKFDDLKDNGIIIGAELARYYGYALGDVLTLIAPGSGIAGQGWRYQLKVVGIFKTGMADFDLSLVLVDLKQAQKIFNLPEDVSTGVGIKLKDAYAAGKVKKEIYSLIGYEYLVKTWIDVNHNLFEALYLEKWGLFIILTFMVIIASFNIISTLIVTVTSKIHDIGILKSIGVPKKSIRRIFTKQGIFIGLVGTLLGVVAGVGVCYILRTYIKVPAEIYSIDTVPVDLQLFDMLVIIVSAIFISYMATIYPAVKAANLQPVEALRYE